LIHFYKRLDYNESLTRIEKLKRASR